MSEQVSLFDYEDDDNLAYADFVERHKPKHTTDDCYTPPEIYDAIAEWVAEEYGVDRAHFVRPFYPGGDYQHEKYNEGDIVVDNPPFSILSQIVKYYMGRNIKFFLFAPVLTMISADVDGVCNICPAINITYENGAVINTGFRTNLEPQTAIRTAVKLREKVETIEARKKAEHELSVYEYPPQVVTAAMVNKWGKYVEFKVPRNEAYKVRTLDDQRKYGKTIFGGGFLISAAQAAAAQAAAAQAAAARNVHIWRLSEKERAIVEALSAREEVSGCLE